MTDQPRRQGDERPGRSGRVRFSEGQRGCRAAKRRAGRVAGLPDVAGGLSPLRDHVWRSRRVVLPRGGRRPVGGVRAVDALLRDQAGVLHGPVLFPRGLLHAAIHRAQGRRPLPRRSVSPAWPAVAHLRLPDRPRDDCARSVGRGSSVSRYAETSVAKRYVRKRTDVVRRGIADFQRGGGAVASHLSAHRGARYQPRRAHPFRHDAGRRRTAHRYRGTGIAVAMAGRYQRMGAAARLLRELRRVVRSGLPDGARTGSSICRHRRSDVGHASRSWRCRSCRSPT